MPNLDLDVLALVRRLEHSQWDHWATVPPDKPVLTRADLQNMPLPSGEFESRSSGATGVPVVVRRSRLSMAWWVATNVREALWFERDWRLSTAAIRANIFEPMSQPSWGPVFEQLGGSGPSFAHPVTGDINGWLQKIDPHYLTVYPSVLEMLDLGKLRNLRGIRTTGETRRHRHPLAADTYSSEEVGTIAIQCPVDGDYYHVMENVLVEILDERDRPAERGRVIVTDWTSAYLHRYDIGDYAELGVCSCGRALQTLQRVLGRARNMAILPDGTRVWPRVGSHELRSVAPIRRYQGAQVSRSKLELRLVVDRALFPAEEFAVIGLVQKWMGHPFDVELVYVEGFPSGKFEEFVCLV